MKIALLFLLLSMTSCMNPTKVIDRQKKEFQSEYKNNFINYQALGRTMRLAWSGDPQKPPLLFVHGCPGSYDAWAEFLVNKDLQKNFHLIAIDRPGYGGSLGNGFEPSLQKQSQMIIQALATNKSGKKAILIGHSYGGPVIAKMAIAYPDKIQGLVFVAAAVDPAYEKIEWYQYPATWKLIRFILPSSLEVCNDEVMALKPELELLAGELKNITAPSVVIQGDEDNLVDPGNLNYLKEKLTGSKVIQADMTAGLNHFVPWKRPDLILTAIKLLQ